MLTADSTTANWLWPAIGTMLFNIAGSLLVSAIYNQRKNGERDAQLKEAVEELKTVKISLNRIGYILLRLTGITPEGMDLRNIKGEH